MTAGLPRARCTAMCRSSTSSTRGWRISTNGWSGNCASSARTSRAAVSPVESDTMCSSTGWRSSVACSATTRGYPAYSTASRLEASFAGMRHDDFLELAERTEPLLYEADQAAWLDRLEREHDNMRAAFDAYVSAGDGERALRLAAALGRFWHMHGHLSEARERLARALSLSDPSAHAAVRARALDWAGTFARYQGDYANARVHFEEALALHRAARNEPAVAGTVHSLGLVARGEGDDVAGRRLLEEALGALARSRRHPRSPQR